MSIPGKFRTALREKAMAMRAHIDTNFQEIEVLAERMFNERAIGNLKASRILMNDVLDLECDVTGDAKIFGDLAEQWGVDEENDRREDHDDA